MKVDDKKVDFMMFNGELDEYWYQLGMDSYKEGISITESRDLTKKQLLSFRKGMMDAAKFAGDLAPEDFYSQTEAKHFSK